LKKVFIFCITLVKQCLKHDILIISNELTYKLLISFFPFLIFLMTILGFLQLDASLLLAQAQNTLPEDVVNIILVFTDEVVNTKNTTLLTASLLISIFSASSGFNAIIKGINKSYGTIETRNFFKVRATSILLVFLFAFTIIISIVSIMFGSKIIKFIKGLDYITVSFEVISNVLLVLSTFTILFATVMSIYKVSSCKKIKYRDIIPGAVITVILWIISSKAFSLYINNFAKYSAIYGSIAGIFVLIFWLNLSSVILLLGAEVNALLEEH
jgi:membrane protein